jgi:hypothetical protein
MLGGKQFAGAAETGGDLIKDQEYAILIAQAPQSPQILG